MATHPIGAVVVVLGLHRTDLNDSLDESYEDEHPLYIDAVVRLKKIQIQAGKATFTTCFCFSNTHLLHFTL